MRESITAYLAVAALAVIAMPPFGHASEIIYFGDPGHSSTGGWAGAAERFQAAPNNGATSTMSFTRCAQFNAVWRCAMWSFIVGSFNTRRRSRL